MGWILRVVAFLLLLPGVALAQTWCAKPAGIMVRDAMFESTNSVSQLLKSFVGELPGPLLLMKRVSPEEAIDIKVAKLVRDFDTDEGYGRYAKQFRRSVSRSEFRDALAREIRKELFPKNDSSNGYWYVYGTADNFVSEINRAFDGGANLDPQRGHVIEVGPGEETTLFDPKYMKSGEHPLQVLAKRTRSQLLVLDEPLGIAKNFPKDARADVRAVLHLDSSTADIQRVKEHYRALLNLRSTKLSEMTVINLFPSKLEDALPWGFEPELAKRYADNGTRFEKLLKELKVSGPEKAWTVDSVVDEINAATAAGKRILLIGEAGKDGNVVRIPNQAAGLTAKDIARISPDASFVGLFCSSEALLSQFNALTFRGSIYTDDASRFLEFVFDRSAEASFQAFLESGKGIFDSVLGAAERLSSGFGKKERPMGVQLYEFSGRNLTTAFRVEAATSSAAQTATQTPSPAQEENRSPLMWFAGGVVGASAREILRWRALMARANWRRYKHPRFWGLSLAMILIAGALMIFLAPVLPVLQPYAAAAGAVGGIAFEYIVVMLSRLRNPSPVAMGGGGSPADEVQDSGRPASAAQFFRT